MNLDKSKNLYFGSNFEEIIYGTNFNFEKIEKYNRSYRIIGIPKEKTFNKIKDINTKNNKTKINTEIRDKVITNNESKK